MIHGLRLAWKKNIRVLTVEVDSLQAHTRITNQTPVGVRLANLVKERKDLLDRDWDVNIRHTYREANQAADFLAKIGLQDQSRRLTVWEE